MTRGLEAIKFKMSYTTDRDDIVNDFLIPALSEAVSYQRAVGYFNSAALMETSIGIKELINNGGKIEIIASPELTPEDVEAIKQGYTERYNECLKRSLNIDEQDPFAEERMNLVAYLVKEGYLDIKIAILENESGVGMYHSKIGIIKDAYGNLVAFTGSLNETGAAFRLNIESIDVYASFEGEKEQQRASEKSDEFNALWENKVSSRNKASFKVLEFIEVQDYIVKKFYRKSPDFDLDKRQFLKRNTAPNLERITKKLNLFPIPENISLRDYQIEAIANWEKEGYRGIFDMATGTGKTFTGLGAISKLASVEHNLLVVIMCPYQHLVNQWVEDIRIFGGNPIIGFSASPQKDWKNKLEDAKSKHWIHDEEFSIFITTNATFTTAFVQDILSTWEGNILLLADEAHNLGSASIKGKLDNRFKYRLALSATLERHRDEEGTGALFNFFGNKCIEYSLERAIQNKQLTPYYYHPVYVTLTEDELREYKVLTEKIAKCYIRQGKEKKLSKLGETLLLKRARLIAGAIGKIEALERTLLNFVNDKNMLIYCGATKIYEENEDKYLDGNGEEFGEKQITAVTKLLGLKLGIRNRKFTSEESSNEREEIKRAFQRGDLQAIVAIKCLDEGVNIPGIQKAFILASTTNPKEYIQRRGRVLRLAEGKEYADIYDFITLPVDKGDFKTLLYSDMSSVNSLVRNEVLRMKEFAQSAINRDTVTWDIKDLENLFDLNTNDTQEGMVEFDE